MVRFIVALLALLASTAAMAEPQRQTFKDAVASSVARRPTRVATPRITRWVATPAVGHRLQRQHHPLRQAQLS